MIYDLSKTKVKKGLLKRLGIEMDLTDDVGVRNRCLKAYYRFSLLDKSKVVQFNIYDKLLRAMFGKKKITEHIELVYLELLVELITKSIVYDIDYKTLIKETLIIDNDSIKLTDEILDMLYVILNNELGRFKEYIKPNTLIYAYVCKIIDVIDLAAVTIYIELT